MAAPLAVNLRIMRNKNLWRALAVGFCALVFFFALHAKTALYNNGALGKLTPSTSSKLWTSGQKMEAPPVSVNTGVLLWIAALLLLQPSLRRLLPISNTLFVRPPGNLPLSERHRFLRPPPALL
jgi:hypothetical protein